jgi:hypothetical protein
LEEWQNLLYLCHWIKSNLWTEIMAYD